MSVRCPVHTPVRTPTYGLPLSQSDQGIRCVFQSVYNKYSYAATNISGSLFIGNRAKTFGGAIYHMTKDLHVKTSSFKNNTTYGLSEHLGAGGAIFTQGSRKITIQSSCFERNEAFGNKAGYGGAIFSDTITKLLVPDIVEKYSTGNKAKVNGGPIFHHKGELRIETSLFKHNTAFGYSGTSTCGAIMSDGTIIIIKSSLFECNIAHGGMVVLYVYKYHYHYTMQGASI